MPEVALRWALPNIATRHPSATELCPCESCAPGLLLSRGGPSWLKVPGVNQHVCPGFCTQAQGASRSKAVGKLWTA